MLTTMIVLGILAGMVTNKYKTSPEDRAAIMTEVRRDQLKDIRQQPR